MINIVIPMAGAGSRFSNAGYTKPKPFIDVAGKPMIVRVLENLAYPNARFFLIARREHIEAEAGLCQQIERDFNASFIPISNLTEGTACTVLYARKHINNDQPLLIANSDQIIDMEIGEFINDCCNRKLDGSILTFIDEKKNPKWSFARIGASNLVEEVREKMAISKFATVGIYFYFRGSDFVDAALDMFIHRDQVNGEYYTCPTFNYLINQRKKIGIFNIPFEAMHGLGTPEDLDAFLLLKSK